MVDGIKDEYLIKGSCACGRVKFIARHPTGETCYCYCVQCRKCSGADYLPFTHFKLKDVQWTANPPDIYRHSNVASRGLCRECGTCIHMIYDSNPTEVGLVLGCIDEGVDQVPPLQMCIWVKEKAAWTILPSGVPTQETMPGMDGYTWPR